MRTKNSERTFGRRVRKDQRDNLYQVRLRKRRSADRFRYWYDEFWFGDQAALSHCVGFAWAHWLSNDPLRQYLDPSGIYSMAQFLDEWKGENYEGTSVRAGAKVLKALGFIERYEWATSVDAIAFCLLEKGPVVFGSDWYEGMFNPDANGVIRDTGKPAGGHAYLLNGVNLDRQMFRVKNSWSQRWGLNGRAWLPFDVAARLLKRDGEACLAIEQRAEPLRRSA